MPAPTAASGTGFIAAEPEVVAAGRFRAGRCRTRRQGRPLPGRIVSMLQAEGFPNFKEHNHAELWKALNAKHPGKGYGVTLSDGQWYWYPRWVEEVRRHCEANRDNYA